MTQQYLTKDGDMVDAICFRYYGSTSNGQVEAVLEANAALDLAGYGPELPAGIVIALPDIAPAPVASIKIF